MGLEARSSSPPYSETATASSLHDSFMRFGSFIISRELSQATVLSSFSTRMLLAFSSGYSSLSSAL